MRLSFAACFFIVLRVNVSLAQITCADSASGIISFGTFEYHCMGIMRSDTIGVSYINGTEVNYSAGVKVHLQEGFHAGGFDSTGKFHAFINNLNILEPLDSNFRQFEKIEFGITIPAITAIRNDFDDTWNPLSQITVNVNDDINAFFEDVSSGIYPSKFTNPYDLDDIDIKLTFHHLQSGRNFDTWGFYYKDFEYDNDGNQSTGNLPEKWIPLNENDGWRARFSPPLVGDYTCSVTITCYRNTPHERSYQISDAMSISVSTSLSDGYLKFNQGSKYLSFSNDSLKTFIPVGYGLLGEQDENRYTFYPGEYYLLRNYLKNLAGRGNYTRVSLGVNYWVEFEEPGNYDPHQKHMWELDELLKIAEQCDIYVLFTHMIWEEFWHSPNYVMDNRFATDGSNFTRAWFNSHPYRKQYQPGDSSITCGGIIDNVCSGFYSNGPLSDFFGKLDAKKLYKNRLRYIIARWGYSTNISAYDLFGEIDNTIIQWKDTVKPTRDFDRPAETDFKEIIFNWVEEMARFVKAHDPNHLVTICKFNNEFLPRGTNIDYDVFNVQALDYIGFDDYGSRRNHNVKRRFEAIRRAFSNAYNPYGKPVEMVEMGHEKGHAPHASEMYFVESMHNAYWSTAFSGMIGPGAYFFKQYLSDAGLKKSKNYYSPLNSIGFGNPVYDSVVLSHEGISFETSSNASDWFWPSWYRISDDYCTSRSSVNGVPLPGWDVDSLDDVTPDYTHHLSTLKTFMNNILPSNGIYLQEQFTSQRFPKFTSSITNRRYNARNRLEAFTLVNANKEKATGWVHNRSNYWGNKNFIDAYNDGYDSLPGFTYDYLALTYLYDGLDVLPLNNLDEEDDQVQEVIQYPAGSVPTFKIRGLKSGFLWFYRPKYEIRWYNTTGVNSINGITYSTTDLHPNIFGTIKVKPPMMVTRHDYAFIIAEDGDFGVTLNDSKYKKSK